MPSLSNFTMTWWYNPETKLGIYGSGFDLNTNAKPLKSLQAESKLTSENGLSASLEEGYRFSNIITEHPVQNSLSISDSVINQPLIVEITGVLSAITPFKVGKISGGGSFDFNTLGTAVNTLINLATQKKGITLTTGLYFGGVSYFRTDNMGVEELYIPRTAEYGVAAIKFQMVLKQVNITNPEGDENKISYSNGLPQRDVGLPS